VWKKVQHGGWADIGDDVVAEVIGSREEAIKPKGFEVTMKEVHPAFDAEALYTLPDGSSVSRRLLRVGC
jgi:hypothetical protein